MNYKRLASLLIPPAYYLLLVLGSAKLLPDDVAGNIWLSGLFAMPVVLTAGIILVCLVMGAYFLWEWLHEH